MDPTSRLLLLCHSDAFLLGIDVKYESCQLDAPPILLSLRIAPLLSDSVIACCACKGKRDVIPMHYNNEFKKVYRRTNPMVYF